MNIGFIGLGNMGAPMVAHLLAAGHRVTVHARRRESAATSEAAGAHFSATPADCAAQAELVLTNVTATEDVEQVLLGRDGVIEGALIGTLCLDLSTISALACRSIAARLAERGIGFLDCPVSGGVRGAQEASLSIMVGGDEALFERALPILQVLGKTITHIGPVGAGQVAKACNQIVQVVNIQGIAEAMRFCTANGVDPQRMLTAISAGFAGSRMLDLEGPKMAKRDFAAGIQARLHAKDLAMITQIGSVLNLDLPAVQLLNHQLSQLVANGWGMDDTASLLRVLEGQD
jgi:2-hydroxy-3-oxopropionate reductase